MKKIDARALPDAALEEKRRQAVKLRKKGMTRAQIGEVEAAVVRGSVLADEPSGNLDSESAERLHKLFFQLRDEMGQTFVIVTHNEELAEMADRKLVMVDGQITP